MIELDNTSCSELLLRLPADRDKSFDYHGCFFRPSSNTTYQLGAFTFVSDDISGFRLKTFADVWTNTEYDPWRVIVYDTAQTSSLGTSIIAPVACKRSSITQNANSIVVVWSGISVGNVDSFDATLTITLVDDWINSSLSTSWNGTPTRFAIDSICVMPLRIAPRHQGISDYAVIPAVFGILSQNPIEHLRYDPSVGGTTIAFRGLYRNVAWYPSGRGWSTGLFGYYETTEGTAWMAWNERFDLTPFTVCFQSDGENLVYEAYVPQEDNILAGNPGRTLEATDFCLRPLTIASGYGWWDMANHYKQRLIELQPTAFFADIRTRRSDLSTLEKGPFLWLDLSLAGFTGSTAYLDTLIDQLRTGLSIDTSTPIFAFGGFANQTNNLCQPYETEIGDARSTYATLFSKNIFPGKYEPVGAPEFDADGFGPGIWSRFTWSGGNIRWWTNIDGKGALRLSRTGYSAGGGDTVLGQYSSTLYYTEGAYTVTNWDNSTKTATVTGNPASDFAGHTDMSANVIPQGGGVMGTASVTSVIATTIVMTTAFKDGQYSNVVPAIGDVIEVFAGNPDLCHHAKVNSSTFITNMETNGFNGKFTVGRVCATYLDVYDEPLLTVPHEYSHTCYRDHSSWSKINAGYVRHPYGGGNWWATAKNSYLSTLKQSVRSLQSTLTGLQAYMMYCEDVNETTNHIFDACFHVISSGGLWRGTDGINPAIDQYKAIPLFSVIHGGRVFGRAINQEFSTAALIDASPYNTAELHRTMAYWLASEWPYGITLPVLSLYADDSHGSSALNLWDDTLYVSGGGTISDEVKQIRQLYEQIQYAELHWIQEYLRYGDMMPLAEIDWDGTDWTQGLANSTYTTGYYSYDVIYERTQFPRVIHSIWKSKMDGTVLVILANWTQAMTAWKGTIPLSALQTQGRSFDFAGTMLDYSGVEDVDSRLTFDGTTGSAAVTNIPPYSIKAILLTPQHDESHLDLIATYRGVRRIGQIQEGF